MSRSIAPTLAFTLLLCGLAPAQTGLLIQGKSVSAWLKALNDPSPLVRQQAANALGQLQGADAKAAVAPLVEAMQDKDFAVRTLSATALAKIGSPDAVTGLVKAIADPKSIGRVEASMALRNLGPRAEPAIPALLEMLNRKELIIRNTALTVLEGIGQGSVAPLIKVLPQAEPDLAELVVLALGRLRSRDAIPALTAARQHKSVSVRLAAAAALWGLGDHGEANFEPLFEHLGDKDLVLRQKVHGYFASPYVLAGPDAMALLTKRLENPTAAVRLRAVQGLALQHQAPKEVIPLLGKALKDPSPEIRQLAAEALGRRGKEAVPVLIEALKLDDPELRLQVLMALRSVGGANLAPAVPTLNELVKDRNPIIRLEAAANLLGAGALSLDDYFNLLTQLMKEPQPEVRYRTLASAGHFYQPFAKTPQHRKAEVIVEDALKDADAGLRVRAAELMLTRTGQPQVVQLALPTLIAGLKEKDATTRQITASVLARMGKGAEPALEELTAALTDEVSEIRFLSAYALGRIGAAAKSAVPALTRALADPAVKIRETAAQALAAIGPDAAAAVPRLIIALKEEDENVRLSAIDALGKIGPAAKQAAPALAGLVKPGEKVTAIPLTPPFIVPSSPLAPRRFPTGGGSRMAGEALLRIGAGTPAVAFAFVVLLKSTDATDRRIAASALGTLGKSAVPELLPLLRDPDPELRALTTEVLGGVGQSPEAVKGLGAALTDPDVNVQQQAALALARLGPAAAAAVPQLVESLTGAQEAETQALAARALGDIGPAAAVAVPDLTKRLDDPDPQVRQFAAHALGGIGVQAKAAITRLTELSNDPDPFIRRAATRALAKIRAGKS
jgi:HEAT repeat protein